MGIREQRKRSSRFYGDRKLIEKAGCELLFLPPYSPDLNLIEHWWQKVNTAMRKELPLYDFSIHKATDAAFQYL